MRGGGRLRHGSSSDTPMNAAGQAANSCNRSTVLVTTTTASPFTGMRAGELERVTRALCVEGALCGQKGRPGWQRTEWLFARARELADRSGTVEARICVTGMYGAALYCNGRYRESVPALVQALDQLKEGSTGLWHEQQAVQYFLIGAFAHLGRFQELQRHQDEWLRE